MLFRGRTKALLSRIALLAIALAGLAISAADPFTVLFYGSYVAVGLILVFRRPRNTVGWLLVAIGFAFLGISSRPDVDIAALQAGHPRALDGAITWVTAWIAPAAFVGFTALAFVFPGGALPSGRWRRPAAVALALGGTVIVLSMFQPTVTFSPNGGAEIAVPNPARLAPEAALWTIVPPASFIVTLGGLALAVISLLGRYRGADEQSRLQLRWLLASLALVLVAIVSAVSVVFVHGDDFGGVAWLPLIVAYPCVPVAIGVAVLRYRLFEIDRIVNRAVVYGAVTAILAGAFAAATTLSQRLFIAVSGQSSDGAAVLTTLVVVSLYAPVRKRVESVVDRLFKYEDQQYGVYLDELRHLLDLVEPSRAAARLAREARAHTGAASVAVTSASGSVLATAGKWTGVPVETVAVDVPGSPIGEVLLARRPDGRPHDPARLRALATVAIVAVAALGAAAPAHDVLVDVDDLDGLVSVVDPV